MKFIILICLVVLVSCQKAERVDLVKTVEQWMGKEIKFPQKLIFTKYISDTVDYNLQNEFKLMVYVDSVGCTSCKLQLSRWKEFINGLDSISNDKISFIFYVCPKSMKEFEQILKRDRFDYPICIDIKDSLNLINKLPSDPRFQVFLLNKVNRIIGIGSPIINPKIKEFYYKIISGNTAVSTVNKQLFTTVSLSNNEVNFGNFPWKELQQAELVINNVGDTPLVITDVITSCGCVEVEYSKEPIRPLKSVILKIKYKAEHSEYFSKTVSIHCNTSNSPISVEVRGNAY